MSIEKLLKNSTIKKTNTLDKSLVFNPAAVVTTNLPILNLALSGDINGGFLPGLIQLAGPSKHFKSNLALLMLSAYLNKYKDGVCLFYDSEFGAKESYFKSFGIDPARIVHSPLLNVEQLKFDMMAQLDGLTEKDKVIVIIDSVGNLASKKEVEDALKQNSASDMSRAKAFKSLFRMVTPQLHDKGITLIAIAHVYQSIEMYSKTIVSGGTGSEYSSDEVIVISRTQDKDDDGLNGFTFNLNINKSRSVIEKSKFPITATFDKGIQKYSGLLDLALETGHVIKPKNGWYTRPCVPEDKSWREKDTMNSSFWNPVLATDFPANLTEMFKMKETAMLANDE